MNKDQGSVMRTVDGAALLGRRRAQVDTQTHADTHSRTQAIGAHNTQVHKHTDVIVSTMPARRKKTNKYRLGSIIPYTR